MCAPRVASTETPQCGCVVHERRLVDANRSDDVEPAAVIGRARRTRGPPGRSPCAAGRSRSRGTRTPTRRCRAGRALRSGRSSVRAHEVETVIPHFDPLEREPGGLGHEVLFVFGVHGDRDREPPQEAPQPAEGARLVSPVEVHLVEPDLDVALPGERGRPDPRSRADDRVRRAATDRRGRGGTG